jgi:hypothetical protein
MSPPSSIPARRSRPPSTTSQGQSRQRAPVQKEAKQVVFQIAAGAMEPTPYLEEGALVVEFYGGTFDAARFRHDVDAALRGEEPQLND